MSDAGKNISADLWKVFITVQTEREVKEIESLTENAWKINFPLLQM
jgi:hypothetical protein